MILSDRSIREEIEKGRIVIRPFDPSCIQPASVDIRLANKIRVFRHWGYPHVIDLHQAVDGGITELHEIPPKQAFSLQAGHFVLGSTLEYIAVPADLMARLEGKSSLGRLGLLIHSTAGYVDPGWKGHLTLELYNVSPFPILLYPGMKISQLSFHRLTTPAERPYGSPGLGSKYQGQEEPTPSRYSEELVQPSLIAMATLHPAKKVGQPSPQSEVLRQWLKNSVFEGSVRRFSDAVAVPRKTVEDWIYRGAQPGPKHRAKVYSVTGLAQYRVKEAEAEAGRLGGLE